MSKLCRVTLITIVLLSSTLAMSAAQFLRAAARRSGVDRVPYLCSSLNASTRVFSSVGQLPHMPVQQKLLRCAAMLGGALLTGGAMGSSAHAEGRPIYQRRQMVGKEHPPSQSLFKAGALDNRLLHALEDGNVEQVKQALSDGADPNQNWQGCCTLLHWAAATGQEEIVALLVQAGASLDASTSERGTALRWAALCNQEGTALKLIELGASIEEANQCVGGKVIPDSFDPAAGIVLPEIELQLPNGRTMQVNDGQADTLLHMAVKNGLTSLATTLVKCAPANRGNRWGETPLHHARSSDMVRLLLKAKDAETMINATDVDGKTALHTAAERCKPEIIQLLVDAGADATIQERWGGRKAIGCCQRCEEDVRRRIEDLLADGAVEKKGKDEENVLARIRCSRIPSGDPLNFELECVLTQGASAWPMQW